jgi:hypothetical protein
MNEAYFMDAGEEFLAHYGVKGMKWGTRRARSVASAYGRGIKRTGGLAKSGARGAGRLAKKGAQLQVRNAKAVGRGAKKLKKNAPKIVGTTAAVGTAAGFGLAAASKYGSPTTKAAIRRGVTGAIRGGVKANQKFARANAARSARRYATQAARARQAANYGRTYRNTATVVRGLKALT